VSANAWGFLALVTVPLFATLCIITLRDYLDYRAALKRETESGS
jgi:hypothetical protein